MTITRHHLVIGLHGSGKTTFIAALWHVLVSGEIDTALRLKTLDGDRTHLNKIREDWICCRPVARTSQQAESHVRMRLEDAVSGQVIEAWFPDMSGESFRDYWERREWSLTYDAIVEKANSVLLFVHPEKIVEPLRIATVNALAGSIPIGAPTAAATSSPRRWDPKQAPTQVQLVELLQLLQLRKPGQAWAVSVIVSAWDIVEELGLTPETWFARRLPLLDQFLRANSRVLRVSHFGVSAQGGELPGDAARLQALDRASEKIRLVRHGNSVTSDITLLLAQGPRTGTDD